MARNGTVNTVKESRRTVSSLRNKISDAAQELYLRDGIDGVSMRKVAEVVGVTAPAIYRHFRNKEELLNEIVVEGLRILEAYLLPGLEAESPYERLILMTERYLDFAVEKPRYFDFAFLVPPSSADPIPQEIERSDWGTFRVAIDTVGECIDQGVFEKTDPLETAITVWAEVHGLVTLFRTGRFGPDADSFRQIYRLCVNRVLRGMMTAEGAEQVGPCVPSPD
jgi:AcrR family transcriptional regulator